MGRMSDLIIEQQQQQHEERLAKKLGITYDELLQLDHEIDTEESNDGLVYNYIISFSDDAPKDILSKITGLDSNNTVWMAPWEMDGDDYYEEQYEAITSNKEYYQRFKDAIQSAEKLNEVELKDGDLLGVLKRQIYISIMAALESFLSEAFINLIDENQEYFRKFIESYPDFKERKIELSRIFSEYERIKETAKKIVTEIIYHNLAKVSNMYSSTFGIEFPNIAELAKCVSIRHDLVHRNGKTKEGDAVNIDKKIVENVIAKVNTFVDDIAGKLEL